MPVDGERAADDGAVAAEPGPPQLVAHDGDERGVEAVVVRLEQATELRPGTQRLEEVSRDQVLSRLNGLVGQVDDGRAPGDRGETGHLFAAIAQVDVIRN